jgi:molybdopterin synthase sulfur carrier subunit
MAVTVRYFASLREHMGREQERLTLPPGARVADVWAAVAGAGGLPGNTLVAVNMEYASADDPVRDGDEVAFFPPVTGGAR